MYVCYLQNDNPDLTFSLGSATDDDGYILERLGAPSATSNVASVRGHPPNPVSITKSDNHVSAPAPTSIPTPYIPPHR